MYLILNYNKFLKTKNYPIFFSFFIPVFDRDSFRSMVLED